MTIETIKQGLEFTQTFQNEIKSIHNSLSDEHDELGNDTDKFLTLLDSSMDKIIKYFKDMTKNIFIYKKMENYFLYKYNDFIKLEDIKISDSEIYLNGLLNFIMDCMDSKNYFKFVYNEDGTKKRIKPLEKLIDELITYSKTKDLSSIPFLTETIKESLNKSPLLKKFIQYILDNASKYKTDAINANIIFISKTYYSDEMRITDIFSTTPNKNLRLVHYLNDLLNLPSIIDDIKRFDTLFGIYDKKIVQTWLKENKEKANNLDIENILRMNYCLNINLSILQSCRYFDITLNNRFKSIIDILSNYYINFNLNRTFYILDENTSKQCEKIENKFKLIIVYFYKILRKNPKILKKEFNSYINGKSKTIAFKNKYISLIHEPSNDIITNLSVKMMISIFKIYFKHMIKRNIDIFETLGITPNNQNTLLLEI